MGAVREGLPSGRYGRATDERADRTLKVVGAVLGAGAVAVLGWFGFSYFTSQDVTGQVTAFQVVSDDAVQVRLEVTKGESATGVCTLRALDADHAEVGRKDVTIDQRRDDVVRVVTVRTTSRATAAELVDCESADGGR
ncbi:DUF4307 domain-containing protein [Streptomyces sp. B1866]|uniref:DUF4307 domain-containing protein n=1 Tax=Streptomyces sp. B1866 TaxID=3075431 RepID=UPI0028910C5C|nr:DUF4307 domain-containing protein [Streptomyces sp. B1866]MDT3396718.1 DUF4307 domain-containing protein [Streptomyces sp. B1866]